MARARERDSIASFDLSNAQGRDRRSRGTLRRSVDDPTGRMTGYSRSWTGRAMRSKGRGREPIFRRRRRHAMVSSRLAAAEQQPLLRSLAKRWSYQRKSHKEQKQHGENATHLPLTIPQAGRNVQEKCQEAYSTGPYCQRALPFWQRTKMVCAVATAPADRLAPVHDPSIAPAAVISTQVTPSSLDNSR